MNPQDDPEARIRQLEQPLADVARTSELGVGQYSGGGPTPTAPLPPPAYGDPHATSPYGAPPFGISYPPAARKGAPVGLIFGLIAVAVVITFGAIAVIAWNMSASEEAVTGRPGGDSSVAGGGGSVDRPTAAPSVPNVEPTTPGGVTTVAPGAPLSVSGVDENRTVACNDGEVSVSGVNNTVTITGHCVSVTVSGVENVVTVDSADAIGASGFDNQVIYLSGSPQIDATGSNVVEQG